MMIIADTNQSRIREGDSPSHSVALLSAFSLVMEELISTLTTGSTFLSIKLNIINHKIKY